MKCNQHGCENPAAFRFTWPGRDEAGICEAHAPKLRNIAAAIGCYVQLIPLEAMAEAQSGGEPEAVLPSNT